MRIPAKELFCFVMLSLSIGSPAQAALTISPAPTVNVSCASNVCTATAKNAILNVHRLQTMLASSNVKVATGLVTRKINVDAGLTWVSSNALTLDAQDSVEISKPVSVAGSGGLAIVTRDGGSLGTLYFGPNGKINFWSLASTLTIDGGSYILVNNITALASNIASNPAGNYALASDYDATPDGTYGAPPIPTRLDGKFEGLGHAISNLTINDSTHFVVVGLFFAIGRSGVVKSVGLTNAKIYGSTLSTIGALAGANLGRIGNSFARGTVSGGDYATVGGLVGGNSGKIFSSYTAGKVDASKRGIIGGLVGVSTDSRPPLIAGSYSTSVVIGEDDSIAGGLVGLNDANIIQSWAGGTVTVGDQVTAGDNPSASAGGLVGENFSIDPTRGNISNCYATGAVTSGSNTYAGGLIGDNYDLGQIAASYAVGAISTESGSSAGGLVGSAGAPIDATGAYWDTTTSGITDLSKGVGDRPNNPGVVGLTTAQFQSGLPAGFDPTVWGQNPSINGGLPYLLAKPPT